jgi:hypothetical protein
VNSLKKKIPPNLGIRLLKFGIRFHRLLSAIFVARNASISMIAIRPLASRSIHTSISYQGRMLCRISHLDRIDPFFKSIDVCIHNF